MKYTTEEIFNNFNKYGTYAATATALGIDARTVRRHVQNHHESASFMASESTRTGVPVSRVSHYWLKTRNEAGDDVSLFVKNAQEAMEFDELRDKLVKELIKYSPHVPPIERVEYPFERDNLLVIDPTDIHMGKAANPIETGGDEYNMDIAYKRVMIGVKDIITKARPFGIEHIAIIIGNDILHIDNGRRTTTGGTPQDTVGQWWEMFERARELYVRVIEEAKREANVTLIYCPSNHDTHLGFGLMDSLYSWYYNDANVTVSDYGKSQRHRKYIQYGVNLIGFTHGDGAKNKDLTSLMQYDAREAWAESKFAYWYVHHMHHKYRIQNGVEVEKDHNGVTVIGNYHHKPQKEAVTIECIRTPSPPDAWHAKAGYVNDTAIEGFIHNLYRGQVARLTSYC